MRLKRTLAGGIVAATSLSCLTSAGTTPVASADARGAVTTSQRVIVVLRDKHTDLLSRAKDVQRASSLEDQLPLVHALKMSGASRLVRLNAVNAVVATVSPAERDRLMTAPDVTAVVPDRQIHPPRLDLTQSVHAAMTKAAKTSRTCPPKPDEPHEEPEALHVTGADAAQRLATGKGLRIALFTDGIDVNNPDFIHPDGSHVITAVWDFTGDGTQDHTDGGEAFGDAGAIAAQGARTYGMSKELPHSGLPKGCTFRIWGFAPDAKLVALKVWGEHSGGWLSQMARAIEDAVWKERADVIKVSTDYGPVPESATDPLRIAVRAAVAAGVTVVSPSGDSGTSGTVSAPEAITVGGTTAFRLVSEAYGYQGYTSDSITALSSGGTTQANRVIDLVAPAQAGMAPCTIGSRTGCTHDTLVWGDNSQAAPFFSGGAALVIQAYEHAHDGTRPPPGLVKCILTGTARDLHVPADEQGSELLDTDAAVKAALGSGGLIPSVPQLDFSGKSGSMHDAPVGLVNTGDTSARVTMTSRTVGTETFHTSHTVTVGAPQDTGAAEGALAAPPVTFEVPSGTPLVNAELGWPGTADSRRLALLLTDPHGSLTQMSYDYDGNSSYSDYQHVSVHDLVGGQWRAKGVWSNGRGLLQDPLSSPGSYRGPVRLKFTGHAYASAGVPELTRCIPAGGTADFCVHLSLPQHAGTASAALQFDSADGYHLSVPVARRKLVADSFTATVTGGVGRTVGQVLGYGLDVPAGHGSLTVDLTAQDPNITLDFYLVTPDDQIAASDTTLTGADGTVPTAAVSLTTNRPAPGALDVTGPSARSGQRQRLQR
ncbi:S8 family serine peptidase [Streptomyces sp. NPDC006476]|uniref:S8 family serine peptidase n=1 Tax=Streptomyces sp. NPDC006476 TaxID=3157175 RepID=UPI0033AA0538